MRAAFALLSGAAFAARVKLYTPPGARSFSPSAPITNPEEFVNTLGGTKAIGGQEDSFGNVLPEVTYPWGFNGWAPTTTLGNGNWWFQSEDRSLYGVRCTKQPSPWIGDCKFGARPRQKQTHPKLSPQTRTLTPKPKPHKP